MQPDTPTFALTLLRTAWKYASKEEFASLLPDVAAGSVNFYAKHGAFPHTFYNMVTDRDTLVLFNTRICALLNAGYTSEGAVSFNDDHLELFRVVLIENANDSTSPCLSHECADACSYPLLSRWIDIVFNGVTTVVTAMLESFIQSKRSAFHWNVLLCFRLVRRYNLALSNTCMYILWDTLVKRSPPDVMLAILPAAGDGADEGVPLPLDIAKSMLLVADNTPSRIYPHTKTMQSLLLDYAIQRATIGKENASISAMEETRAEFILGLLRDNRPSSLTLAQRLIAEHDWPILDLTQALLTLITPHSQPMARFLIQNSTTKKRRRQNDTVPQSVDKNAYPI